MATQVVTGAGINNDALNWLNSLGAYDLGDRRLALDTRGQQDQMTLALMDFYQRAQDSDKQYALDRDQLGLQAADLRRQQRLDAATADLNDRMLALDTERSNFQQRDSAASKKLQIVDMLSSRTGPQDWVKYNSMINQLSPPDPARSQAIDVFSILDGLVKESEVRKPGLRQDMMGDLGYQQSAAPTGSSTPQSWQELFGQVQSSYGNTAQNVQPAYSPQQPTTYQPTNSFDWSQPKTNNPPTSMTPEALAEQWYSGVPNSQVANIGSGQGALVTTGGAGPSYGRDYKGWNVYNPATQSLFGPDDEIGANTALWLQRLGMGGSVKGGNVAMALTGDGTGKKPNKDSEIAVASVEKGKPRLDVLNPKQTKKAMKKVKPKRMATGGTLYPSGSTVNVNQYSPETLGSQPFIQKLRGKMPANQFQALGGQLSNPEIGVENMPWAINLKTFNALNPTEQQASAELYETGLGVNFNDLYEQARRAAPFGRMSGPTRYAA